MKPWHIILAFVLFLIITCGAFAFYSTHLTAVLDHDSISYSLAIEKDSWTEIYHAHHLLYGYFKWVVWDVLKANGYEGRALPVNQIFNAFFGALGVGLIFLVVRYFSGSYFLGFLASVFLAFANGYWYCATFGGVRIMGTFFLLATFFAVSVFVYEKWLNFYQSVFLIIVIALLHSLAVFCHQTNLMFAAVVCTVMLFKKDTLLKKVSYFYIYLVLLLSIVAGLYWYIGWKVFYCTTWERYHTWLTAYTSYGLWGKFTDKSIPDALIGVRALFCGFIDGSIFVPGLGIRNNTALNTFINTSRILLLLFAGLSFWLFKKWKAVILGITVWILLYVPFFIWWEPANMEFWLPMLPVILILAALPLGLVWNSYRPVRLAIRIATGLLLAYVVLVFAWYNYQNLILPKTNPENNGYISAMNNLAEVREGPEDLVVIMGWDALRINLNYYFSQDYISIYFLSTKYRKDPDGFYDYIYKRISDKIKQKHKVFIAKDVLWAKNFDDINSTYKSLEKDAFIKFFKEKYEQTPVKEGKNNYFYEAKIKTTR